MQSKDQAGEEVHSDGNGRVDIDNIRPSSDQVNQADGRCTEQGIPGKSSAGTVDMGGSASQADYPLTQFDYPQTQHPASLWQQDFEGRESGEQPPTAQVLGSYNR